MVRADENHPGLIRHENIQGVKYVVDGKLGGAGMGQARRALSTMNRNMVVVPPLNPCAVRKRTALSEKDGSSDNTLPAPANRPVTRKFAAQMANKQHLPIVEEPKKVAKTVHAPSRSDDCNIVDVEDYGASDDYPVPMSVQHTMHMIEESDSTEEMEMEDVDEEPLDIDSGDKQNPLSVVEYIDDIYAFYKKVESSSCVPSNYMVGQVDINEKMRATLVDWLIEVHYKFELMEETLYLTVNLIDRFLAIRPVVRKKLQLVGVTAMLLACKYEEFSVPIVEDLIQISDRAYSRKDVLEMESLMVNTLQFNLSPPTPYVFMRRFLKAAESDKKMELVAFFIIEMCLVEYQMLKYPPSLLAAAAVYTAQCSLTGSQYWSPTCEKYTAYSEFDIMECARMMVIFHQKAGTRKLTGVYRKYSSSKYGHVAKSSEAANFLLGDDDDDGGEE